MGVHMPTLPDADRGIPKGGGRSRQRPRAPERQHRSSGRAATARQPATYGSAGTRMEMTFRCTCTPMSDVHPPISTHPRRSAFKIRLQGAVSSAMSRSRGSSFRESRGRISWDPRVSPARRRGSAWKRWSVRRPRRWSSGFGSGRDICVKGGEGSGEGGEPGKERGSSL